MPRRYSVQFNAVAVTAAQDLVEINAHATKPVTLISFALGQTSDAGDAEDEQLRILMIRGYTSSGSAGSSPTAVALDPGDAAFGGTTEVNNTTPASGGSPVTCHAEVFNVRAGYVYCPVPEARIVVAANTRLVINLPTAPADSLTMSGTAVFEEIG